MTTPPSCQQTKVCCPTPDPTQGSLQLEQRIILVDDDIQGDLRLLRAVQSTGNGALVIDIRNETEHPRSSRLTVAFKVLWLITHSLVLSLVRYRRLSRVLNHAIPRSWFTGLHASIRWLIRSVYAADVLKTLANSNLPRVVYAHDLYCAVAALLIMPTPNTRLIYDSHELQIHRHRKLGRLRILIEYGLEQRILRHAKEVRAVNQAISTVMMDLYQIPATVGIEYNDHYTHHSPAVPSLSDRPALVFVGKGLRGRQLEVLDRSSVELGFDVHAYLLGTRLPISISGRYWHYGPEQYDKHLLALVRSQRSMMWCCVDSQSLSYRLATPNKFFQALAMGIPIIASKETYLASIVHRYGIGAVYEGGNLSTISRQVMSPLYEQWVSATQTFRTHLRSGAVVI
jgi:hypothetical protein